MNLEGQVEGAIQMGLGYALSESIDLDAKGKVTNGGFRQSSHIFTAPEMPHPGQICRKAGAYRPPTAGESGECSVVPLAGASPSAVSWRRIITICLCARTWCFPGFR